MPPQSQRGEGRGTALFRVATAWRAKAARSVDIVRTACRARAAAHQLPERALLMVVLRSTGLDGPLAPVLLERAQDGANAARAAIAYAG